MSILIGLQLVGINAETVSNVHASDFPHHYVGEDNSWDLEKFTNVGFFASHASQWVSMSNSDCRTRTSRSTFTKTIHTMLHFPWLE